MTSPYTIKELHRVVAILPRQMNADVKNHAINNLKADIVGKCIDDGYVLKVYKVRVSDCELMQEDFSGKGRCNVTFTAKICCPILGTVIMCRITTLTKSMIQGSNGPITAIIELQKYNPTKFNLNQNGEFEYKDGIQKKRKLAVGDVIKLLVQSKKYDNGRKNITVLGMIEDFANDKEIKKFDDELKSEVGQSEKFIKPEKVNIEDLSIKEKAPRSNKNKHKMFDL